MKNDKPIVRLKSNSRWSDGVHVFEADFVLLQQLLIHGTLSSTDVHEMFTELFEYSSSNTITNRLMRIRKAGLIAHMKKPVLGNITATYYRLDDRGFEVLEGFGLINKKQIESIKRNPKRKSIPTSHSILASTLANKIFIDHKKKSWEDLNHMKGSAHPHFGNVLSALHDSKPFESLVIPDWVIDYRDTLICLEIDTGSQRKDVIRKKYENYVKEQERLLKVGKKMIVLFAVVDDFVDEHYSDNRERRLGSIKESGIPYNSYHTEQNEFESVLFYVLNTTRAPLFVRDILAGMKPQRKSQQQQTLDKWLQNVIATLENSAKGYHVKRMNIDDVFLPRRERSLDCDTILSLTWQQGRFTYERRLAVLYADEGSLASYQRIHANAQRVVTATEVDGTPTQLLVCYPTKEEMEQNTLGFDMQQPILETDRESWQMESGVVLAEPPEIIQVVSPYKKEWRQFHE